MPIPRPVRRLNTSVFGPVMLRFVGIGPLAELQHVGRRSGRRYRTPLLAFRDGDAVTIALTYGSDVDWLANVRAAGGGRLRLGSTTIELGPPRGLDTQCGMDRMPLVIQAMLLAIQCREFVELPATDA